MLHKRKLIKQIIESFSQKESSPPEAHGISKTILEENNEEAKKAKRIFLIVFQWITNTTPSPM